MTEAQLKAFHLLRYEERVSLILKALARDIDEGTIEDITLHQIGPGNIHIMYTNPKQEEQ